MVLHCKCFDVHVLWGCAQAPTRMCKVKVKVDKMLCSPPSSCKALRINIHTETSTIKVVNKIQKELIPLYKLHNEPQYGFKRVIVFLFRQYVIFRPRQ